MRKVCALTAVYEWLSHPLCLSVYLYEQPKMESAKAIVPGTHQLASRIKSKFEFQHCLLGPRVNSKLKSAQPAGVITKTLEWLRFAPLIAGNRSEREATTSPCTTCGQTFKRTATQPCKQSVRRTFLLLQTAQSTTWWKFGDYFVHAEAKQAVGVPINISQPLARPDWL